MLNKEYEKQEQEKAEKEAGRINQENWKGLVTYLQGKFIKDESEAYTLKGIIPTHNNYPEDSFKFHIQLTISVEDVVSSRTIDASVWTTKGTATYTIGRLASGLNSSKYIREELTFLGIMARVCEKLDTLVLQYYRTLRQG